MVDESDNIHFKSLGGRDEYTDRAGNKLIVHFNRQKEVLAPDGQRMCALGDGPVQIKGDDAPLKRVTGILDKPELSIVDLPDILKATLVSTTAGVDFAAERGAIPKLCSTQEVKGRS